jgi:PAS domain S-box-containing protein
VADAKPADVESLQQRLREAEETLEAIRTGQVEALIVTTATGPKIYTLEGADHRYRRIVETMNEGALLVSPLGVIVYSNAAFAAMLSVRLETVIGKKLASFVPPSSRPALGALLRAGRSGHAADELTLRVREGRSVPAYLSVSPGDEADTDISVIVTNLTAQKRNEEIVASERLASSILDQAAEAIIVCDPDGIVIRTSRAARSLSSEEALRRDVQAAFPLEVSGDAGAVHPVTRALAGEVAVGVEASLVVRGRPAMHVLCTTAPLLNDKREILGCVLSLIDISAQKRAESERLELLDAERAARTVAERARAEAEASNRSKDEFLASVSHELRTPLNAITGWARLLAEEGLPLERRRTGVEVIRRNAAAQTKLIEDLLDVSRIVSGQMRLDVRATDPARAIRSVVDGLRPALDAKALVLTTEIDQATTSIMGDETRLQQIVWNLVSNAVKFTPRGGQIRVALKRDESGIEIVVADNGPGIASDFLPYVFDRFRQADGSISRSYGGLGLGLAISRHLVELHGGNIAVASDGLGLGATFTVRLPRVRPRELPTPAHVLPAAHESTADSSNFECVDLDEVHILVVEDDEDSRDLLMNLLSQRGAKVTGASSGEDALRELDASVPNVLISDIGMPTMDGYALIRRVRTLPSSEASKVPAIALTAYARTEDKRRSKAEGFQMHLTKPVNPTELVKAIASLSNGRTPSSR